MELKKGELFCGPGGIALGAQMVGPLSHGGTSYSLRHEWANDIDTDACNTFRKNICPERPESVICQDVRSLDIEGLPKIEVFSFGFPCNDYSVVGEQKGLRGEYGPLYTYGIRVLNFHNPLLFLAENVGGLRSANKGKAIRLILNEMATAGRFGYELTLNLFKFEQYGVPQTRHRIVIIGFRKDLGLTYRVPAPTHKAGQYLTAQQAIEEPPLLQGVKNNELTRHSKRVVELLSHIPPGKNAWYEGIPENLRLNVAKARLSQIYRRLEADKPSYTITGSGGGGTHCYHWLEPRALTNRERARIQTFPDDFEFCGPKESVRKQIGMAVPPKGAEAILRAAIQTLIGIEFPTVEAK